MLSDVLSTSSNQRRFDLHSKPFFNVVLTSIFVVKSTSLFDVGATLLSDVVPTSLNQRRIDLRFQHFYNVVSTSGADVVSTLYRRLFARWVGPAILLPAARLHKGTARLHWGTARLH